MQLSEIQAVKQRFGIIGTSELLNRAIDIAVQVAPTDLSVLITGESGVGKELVGKCAELKYAPENFNTRWVSQ